MKNHFFATLSAMTLIAGIGLTSCGGASGDAAAFTVLINKSEESVFYESYNDNPIVKYLESISEEKFGKQIDLQFESLVPGSEKEQFQTIISTGEYYDLMPTQYSTSSISSLYEEGVILDLTPYIEEYMPNYKKLLETNEELGTFAYTVINGEKKILNFNNVLTGKNWNFCGYWYRRDWIAKYGAFATDISAELSRDGLAHNKGDKFTANFEGEDIGNTYSDNIVFPSWTNPTLREWYLNVDNTWDGSYPVFISDWEWMFEAFTTAINSSDSHVDKNKAYCVSLPYSGTNSSGDFFSGFGGGGPEWYKVGATGQFGGYSEQMKSYIECMSTWYKKGWIDPSFNERSQDMFYSIDTAGVHSGQVGAWNGRKSEYGHALRTDVAPATQGMFVTGAPQPINDKYGAESTRMHLPDCFYNYSTIGNAWVLTESAKNKDLSTLFKFLDFMYSTDGMLIKEAVDPEYPNPEENRILKDDFYSKFGFTEGIYKKVDEPDGTFTLHETPKASESSYNAHAGILNRFDIGLTPVKELVFDERDRVEVEGYTIWSKYDGHCYINDYIPLLNASDSSVYASMKTKVEGYMFTNVPAFIKGAKTLEDDWATYEKTLKKYQPEKVTDIFTNLFESKTK